MKRKYALGKSERRQECGTKQRPHSFVWTGKTPNTGIRQCIFCGYVEEDK